VLRELFHVGSFSVSPFGVMLVVAFLAAYAQLRWGLRRLGAGDEEDASALLFAGGVGGIVGAKIYYAALYRDWRLLIDRSGLVWYGGFVAGAICILWVMRRRRLRPWPTADAVAPALSLGYACGRVGCFLVGDDYGVPTGLPWGVRFPVGLPPSDAGNLRSLFGVELPPGVPDDQLIAVHPTQLYEALAALAVWGLGCWLLRRRAAEGATVLAVVALLATERFAVEFLRAKDDRLLGTFTVAQAISVGVLAAVVAFWLWRRSAGARQTPPGGARPARPG
jgi:phosphatidylglycerol:prolipoprotein diacylglycerol transferase